MSYTPTATDAVRAIRLSAAATLSATRPAAASHRESVFIVYTYVTGWVCRVSVSTRVLAGLCRGPGCRPAARRCSSAPGLHCSASAGRCPTLPCAEGWPGGGGHDINRMSGEGRFKTANSDEWAHGALPGKRPSRPCLAPPAGGLALHSRWSTKPTEAGTESGPPQTPAEAAGKDETLKSLRWIKSVSRYFEWISRGQITENVGKLQRVKLWNNDVVTSSGAVPTASQEEKMIIASYVIKVWPVFLDGEATRVHCSASQLFYVILCLPTLRRDDK